MTHLERAIQKSKKREERTWYQDRLTHDDCVYLEFREKWEPKWRELFLSALECIELMQAMAAGHPLTRPKLVVISSSRAGMGKKCLMTSRKKDGNDHRTTQ